MHRPAAFVVGTCLPIKIGWNRAKENHERRAFSVVQNAQERRQVFYHGDVQGVGFRYTTQIAAGAFQVTGFVQNLSDGRVKLTCEGACLELDAFLEDVARRMASNITHLEMTREVASGEFEDFEIRG